MALVSLTIAIVALCAWALAEVWKRPRIEIRPAEWSRGTEPWVFAVVRVRNRPPSRVLRWFLVRQSAEGCEATIEFRRAGEADLAIPETQARWSGTPQPLRIVGVDTAGQIVKVFDQEMVPATTQIDLPPTEEGHELAVAFIRDDGSAYAWSATSYAYGMEWRNPEWAPTRRVRGDCARARVRHVEDQARNARQPVHRPRPLPDEGAALGTLGEVSGPLPSAPGTPAPEQRLGCTRPPGC